MRRRANSTVAIQLGLAITHVPYKGAGVALTDLLSGAVQVTWNNLTSNLSNVTNGKLRAQAVAAPRRVAQLPSVPTFDELKLPELNLTSWTGLAAPAGMPDAVVSRLYQGILGTRCYADLRRCCGEC